VEGADAVISAIGPRGTGTTTVIRDSVRSIIQAMDKTDTQRFVQASGSVVAGEGESPYMRYLVRPVPRRTFLRHVSADRHAGEDEIRRSDPDWTILRPPSLNGKAAAGTYRTAIDRNLPHGFKRLPRRPGHRPSRAARRPGDRAQACGHRQLTARTSPRKESVHEHADDGFHDQDRKRCQRIAVPQPRAGSAQRCRGATGRQGDRAVRRDNRL
jgi:hypothetical protein